MDNIKILDCTLRDGGYINNWSFGLKVIKGIITNLIKAKIEIIECGFIREGESSSDMTIYSSIEQLRKMIEPKNPDALYAVMIEEHNHVEQYIPPYDGSSVDIVRVTFRKNEWMTCKSTIASLVKKGYKVCVQPVGTTNYSDDEMIKLITDVNELQPYAFYLVDTMGVMYNEDLRYMFSLIDSYLSHQISIGFHSHNNLQMSFSNAQEMIKLSKKRNIIVDASCYGMGRGVGNLTTELLVDYLNNVHSQSYSIIPILNIIDKYLMPIYAEHRWGYDLPYLLSAAVKCHPNYAIYLMRKETLDIERIEKILSLIPHEDRGEYNEQLINRLYLEFQSAEVDDTVHLEQLKAIINNREVLIMGPGPSLFSEREKILECIDGKFVIMTNFFNCAYKKDALFISNEKRFSGEENEIEGLVLSTSNLSLQGSLVFNYSSLLGEGNDADNAGAMLIRLLKKIGVKKIWLAGFDGYDVDASKNFIVDGYKKLFENDFVKKKNEDVSKQFRLALIGIDYKMLTRTKYEI